MGDGLQMLLQFSHYAVLLGLFGFAAFRLVGLRRVDVRQVTGFTRVPSVAIAVAAPILTVALMVSSISAMMGQSLSELEPATIEGMVFSTDLGWAFLARLALLTAALPLMVWGARSRSGLGVTATFYGLALLTLGWSGHAAVTEGVLGLVHRLNNGVHLWAAGLWIGAIGWFLFLTIVSHRTPERIDPLALLQALHRFAPWGIILVSTVVLTGLLNGHLIFGLPSTMETLSTDYGKLLLAKVLAVGAMLICAGFNAASSRQRVKSSAGPRGSDQSALASLRTSLTFELVLALTVIFLVVSVGSKSPVI